MWTITAHRLRLIGKLIILRLSRKGKAFLKETIINYKSLSIFPILAVLFCFSMFYRVTNAVIAPDLIREFNLDAEKLGMLGSAFFYTFAIFQIPMGILLDRIGPRKVISCFSLIGASGAFLFASAGNFQIALAGRALLGIGMASVLMGALKVFVVRYSREQFSVLSGFLISIGTVGSILATSPLVYLNSAIGWRLTFVCAGIINTTMAVLVFLLLREDNRVKHPEISCSTSPQKTLETIKTLKSVFRTLSFWQIGTMAFFRYGTLVALQGVWLGPYLMNVKHFTPVVTGNILMMLSLGLIAGSPVAGYLADKIFLATKPVIIIGLTCYILCLVPFTGIWNIENAFAYSMICVLLGFFSSSGMLAYTHIKELFPLHMSGTVTACVNFFIMAGGAFFMQIIGTIISFYTDAPQTYSPGAYHMAFFVCLIGMTGGLSFYAFSKSSQQGTGPGFKLEYRFNING